MNPKDVPFAATYAWGVVALLRVLLDLPRLAWGKIALFGVLAGFAMATRPPGVALFGFFALFLGAWVVTREVRSGFSGLWKTLLGLAFKGAVALVIAWATLLPFWPRAQRSLLAPFTSSTDGLARLQNVAAAQPVLYGGEFFSANETPWTYSLWMFAIKQPEWILLLLGVGAFAAVFSWRKAWTYVAEGDRFAWGVLLVLGAAIVPWVFVIVSGASIHNGFRHMFYVLPFVAVAAALSLCWLISRSSFVERYRSLLLGFGGVLVAFNLYGLVSLYPYQYIYYNSLVGGVSGAYGSYETDYWFLGAERGFEIVEEDRGDRQVAVMMLGPRRVARYYLREGMELVSDLADATYYVGRPIPDLIQAGRVVGSVERRGVPLLVVVDLSGIGIQ
ncbi:hypothetical protein [Pelagicoccus sp. SDUM812003]|uniref:hypothetical protein n=1 Tax=Pelagicoccus sp. SDUM812003 TaxID=3041267 RepID=UPI00280FA7F6|nr:hypothetical protein [Pelagicoccus sp. SDUM812003]MDQ8202368.1 hypothetical protein [Pelagicoccus sp. SDUM812003]